MPQSKPILFMDFNGVISYNNYWCSLEDTNHELTHFFKPVEQYVFMENRELLKDWMKGKHTSESVHEIIGKQVGVDSDKLLQVFIQDCRNIDTSEKILEALQELKEGYYLILRTDNMDSFDRFTLPRAVRLKEVFDRIDNSFNLGELKRDNNGQYFLDRAKEQNISINQCYFIDDSQKNCDFYTELGGRAYCATGEDNVVSVLKKLLNGKI